MARHATFPTEAMPVKFVTRVAIAAVIALLVVSCSTARAEHPGALWAVVRACILNSRITGSSWPCLHVDRMAGYVVVGDPRRRTQVLVTPTVRISGIESPALLTRGAANYWRAAWSARSWLDRRAGRTLAAEDVGLAVNSVPGRTQDELHIHLDCLRPSVRLAIDASLAEVSEAWSEPPMPLIGDHRYRARWLAQVDLQTVDPFKLLAADPAVGGDRSLWTMVMVAAHRPSGEQGFVLLSHHADYAAHDLAAGEELLDHRCAALTGRLPPR